MKTFISLFFILQCSFYLYAQNIGIGFDLSDRKPSYIVSDGAHVQLSVQSPSIDNLLRHYDADPFEKPVILPEEELDDEIAHAMGQYLSGIGIRHVKESDNRVNLKVRLCALNFLSGKGWTATVKIDLRANDRNRELLYQVLSGYTEEGGGESEFSYAEQAMNNALFEAFESVNWEQLDGSFPRLSSSYDSDRDIQENLSATGGHAGQTPGLQGNERPIRVGAYHALIIAIEDYHYMNKLDQPIRDATRLIEILASSYNFSTGNIIFLKNPTREEIIDKLDLLVRTVKEDDNLLIFYAGHGYWDQARETGYWLPVDAKMSSTANWLRNTTIQEYIGDIHSKHTLLIADACFGGGIFKTRKAFNDAPSSINQMYELASRKAITSGMLNEVPDRSVFFEYLIKRLERNEEQYTSSLQLFSSFRIAVMNNSDNVPQYGTIQKAGDEGGDFIFVKSR